MRALCDITRLNYKDCLQMVLEDGDELRYTLIKIFKLDSRVYQEVTSTLEREKISILFKESSMERIQALLLSGEDNDEMRKLLQETLESDVVLYLKILQEIKVDI